MVGADGFNRRGRAIGGIKRKVGYPVNKAGAVRHSRHRRRTASVYIKTPFNSAFGGVDGSGGLFNFRRRSDFGDEKQRKSQSNGQQETDDKNRDNNGLAFIIRV